MKRFICSIIFMMFLSPAMAVESKAIHPQIVLNHIGVIKASEREGDELYFDISVIPAGKESKYYRVPKSPLHWDSKLIDRVKNIPLWSNKLESNETIILLISLMDADSGPFNPDDLVGIMRAEVKNNNGKLQIQWTVPNSPIGPATIAGQHGDIQKFELRGVNGQYDVYLEVKDK